MGLPSIRYSRALSYVALVHSWDVMENMQGKPPPGGNLHSWSGQVGSRVVYTSDHRAASGMWNKPMELGTGYKSEGFEISHWCSGPARGSLEEQAEGCIQSWQGSPGHHELMINRGSWTSQWGAVGAGWYSNKHGFYACIWFGKEPDR
jgi:hypothetical protein